MWKTEQVSPAIPSVPVEKKPYPPPRRQEPAIYLVHLKLKIMEAQRHLTNSTAWVPASPNSYNCEQMRTKES